MIVISIICLVLVYSCKPIETEIDVSQKYFISLGEFVSYEEADAFKAKTDLELWRELRIKQIEEKRFLLLYGSFESSFDAGEKGFELYSKSMIHNFKIFKGDGYVHDNFSNLMFIAKYQWRQSIYSFNLASKKIVQVWSRWGRKVVTLNHAHDNSSLFFTTALGFGKQGSFPYVRDARLYYYQSSKDLFEEIEEFGTGLQLYTYWENPDTFKVNVTKPDSLISNLFVQDIYSYHLSGAKGTKSTRSFNLIKEGFPKPPLIRPEYFSPSKKLQMREVNQQDELYLYLRNVDQNSEVLIAQTNGKLSDTRWSKTSRFVVCNISSTVPKKSYELIVIDSDQKKSLRTFHSASYMNSLLHGNLLFFEEETYGSNAISIYDCVNDTLLYKITMPGGCGIYNLK